jgi:hypothetical protein
MRTGSAVSAPSSDTCKELMSNHGCRITNIMSQNRYMKNIVHTPQRIRQGQSIGHGPLSFHNLERSHELGREFSSLSQLDRILMRLNPQEDSIVDLVTTVDSVRIGITLLSILRFIYPWYYGLYLLFHFLDRFWSHQDPILKPIPTQGRPTRSPIKKLNGAILMVIW